MTVQKVLSKVEKPRLSYEDLMTMFRDQTEDAIQIHEIMSYISVGCKLEEAMYFRKPIKVAKEKHMKICKACGSCEVEDVVRKKIECRWRAANEGKTLAVMCADCGTKCKLLEELVS